MKNRERGILSPYDFHKPATKLAYGVIVIVIAAMVVSMLYPIFVTFFNGLKTNVAVNSFPPRFFPDGWHWENFRAGWDFFNMPLYLRNTLFIFTGNMIVTILVLGLAAFSLSHLDVPRKKAVTAFFLATLFIPPTTYIIPNFVNIKELGLLNSFWAFWLPAGASAFHLLLLKTFLDGIHHELFEAARMDGASEFRCFWQIAFPLSIPIFSTLAIFVFSGAWNDWFWPSLIMHQPERYPLSTAIYKYVINARQLDLNIRFAILSIVMLPPIAVFLLFQKFIMRGLQLGSVKG
jgi:multiple sugar transport system permease protein